MTNTNLFRTRKVFTALALVAAAQLTTACVAEVTDDELLLDEAAGTAETDEDVSARQARSDELVTAEEIGVAEDVSENTLCLAYSESFPVGNISWSDQTPYRPCVAHYVDLNRSFTNFPARHWARGVFPQYSGAFSLDDMVKCSNSFIRVQRWHGPSSATILLVSEDVAATYEQGGDGLWDCAASYASPACGNLGYDNQKARVQVFPNGSSTANGATVTHYFAKGITDCG